MLETRFQSRPVAVFGIFDGLGGEPNGDVAAYTASTELPLVVPRCQSVDDLLPSMNEAVLRKGGYTTAVVALVEPSGATLFAHVGDSGAFMLRDGTVKLLTERDAAPNGSITDFLGNPHLRGHVTSASLPKGASLLLATDGVDGVVGAAALSGVLAASPHDVDAALDRLYEEIRGLGAPDNATLVWIHRN